MTLDLRAPLARVRGLGSAQDGTHHWWMQRVTALALVPLSLWFALSLVSLAGADYTTAVSWLRSSFNAALMAGLLIALFYHAYLGLRVVLEDYVHHHGLLIASVLVVKFALALLALMALLAVVRVYLGG